MPVYPRLTEMVLKRATVTDGAEETHWDGEVRGLGVRIRSFAGVLSRTWIIKYRNAAGAQRKMTLGDWPGLTVSAARTIAKKQIGRIADKADPVREKARTREAGTVALLLSRFLKDHVEGKKRSETTAKEYKRLVTKVIIPELGSAQVAAVERADVERWFTKLSATPRQANQALAVLSKAMSLAENWRLRAPFTNPCKGVERYPESQRDRYPTEADYIAIGGVLREFEREGGSSTNANLIRLLALTGLRLSEARLLRWRNVDTKRGTLALEKVKNGRAESKIRVVGAESLAVLATQRCENENDFVFPSGNAPDQPISVWTIESFWKRVRKKSGIKDLRLHDLRHGVATLAASFGANAFVVRDKMGHATLQMTNRYVGRPTDPLTQITEKIETSVTYALNGVSSANVIQLAGNG